MVLVHRSIFCSVASLLLSIGNSFPLSSYFSPPSRSPTVTLERCLKGSGFGNHVGARCIWGKNPSVLFARSEGNAAARVVGSATGTENDFRSFLNQCTIQSFMFLLRSTRDPHTIRWLDNFTQPVVDQDELDAWNNVQVELGDGPSYVSADDAVPSELLRYHGLGAMNMTIFPTWESYFRDLLRQSGTVLVVETYDPRFPQFEIDVNPVSLCSRMLSVREQIAREFATDLGSIADMGRDIYHSYKRQAEKLREEGFVNDDEKDGGGSGGKAITSEAGFDRQSMIFLEWDPLYDADAAPSPLRKGNFDLLVLLSTQESIHRLIRSGVRVADEAEEEVRGNTVFLRKFYGERLRSHFIGNQRYGRADDFLEELFLNPAGIVSEKGEGAAKANPLVVAEAILMEREQVALEWREIANLSPREHMEIRKVQLNKMMGL